MANRPRQQLFIDRRVQGTLVSRVVLYWFLFVVGMFFLLAGFPLVASCFVRSPGTPTAAQIVLQTWRVFWPVLFASGLMLPVLILDVLRVSHRFVGPLVRLRAALRDLADGKQVSTVKFRSQDFWFELAEDFNRAAVRSNQAIGAHSSARRATETVVEDTASSA